VASLGVRGHGLCSDAKWLVRVDLTMALGESDDPQHLIPLGDPSVPRVVVGHNVSFDRARIKEEYSVSVLQTGSLTRWPCTSR